MWCCISVGNWREALKEAVVIKLILQYCLILERINWIGFFVLLCFFSFLIASCIGSATAKHSFYFSVSNTIFFPTHSVSTVFQQGQSLSELTVHQEGHIHPAVEGAEA